MTEIKRTITDLQPDTRYIVRARTINGFGVKSDWSEALDFTTSTDTTIPQSPENLYAAFNNSDLLISWDAPTYNTDWTYITDFSHYEVTITPSPTADPETYVHNTSELVYVFTYQLNVAVWTTAQGVMSIEVRTVDTAGNKSAASTAIASAAGTLTESGISSGDISGLGFVLEDDFDTGTILYAAVDNTPVATTIASFKTILGISDEATEDLVGAMVSGNTETGISVTYDDGAGKLNFDVGAVNISFDEGINISTGTTTGTQIATSTSQKIGFYGNTPVVQPSAYSPSNVTTDRTYDANSTSIAELADVLGTLISDLQSLGLIG